MNTLTVTDNRTGQQYDLPIENGTIKALDLRKIKVNDNDFGLMTYDPAFMNTASCKSRITFIDGDKGILEYRGIPIDEFWKVLEGSRAASRFSKSSGRTERSRPESCFLDHPRSRHGAECLGSVCQ